MYVLDVTTYPTLPEWVKLCSATSSSSMLPSLQDHPLKYSKVNGGLNMIRQWWSFGEGLAWIWPLHCLHSKKSLHFVGSWVVGVNVMCWWVEFDTSPWSQRSYSNVVFMHQIWRGFPWRCFCSVVQRAYCVGTLHTQQEKRCQRHLVTYFILISFWVTSRFPCFFRGNCQQLMLSYWGTCIWNCTYSYKSSLPTSRNVSMSFCTSGVASKL